MEDRIANGRRVWVDVEAVGWGGAPTEEGTVVDWLPDDRVYAVRLDDGDVLCFESWVVVPQLLPGESGNDGRL